MENKWEIKSGDILTCNSSYIAHQTNCRTNDAEGMAKMIFDSFPYANTYKNRIWNQPSQPGTIDVVGDITIGQQQIINMYAQDYPGPCKEEKKETKELRLEWFQSCLEKIKEYIIKENPNVTKGTRMEKSIAFPYRIGCNLDGEGEWDHYLILVQKFAVDVHAYIQVWIIHPSLSLSSVIRILVCGDRNWNQYEFLKSHLQNLIQENKWDKTKLEIVHGACQGADRLAGQFAQEENIPVQEFPADWKKYGKRAGPIRNYQMIQTQPLLVLAFHSDIQSSRGTKSMIKISLDHKVPVLLCDEKHRTPIKSMTQLDGHLQQQISFPPLSKKRKI